jgi:2'-5' RNA ligase
MLMTDQKKTHHTAVVLIPPAEAWPPIQAIRQRHDRHARRWVMPHITLLYPFRPRQAFPAVAEQLAAVCRTLAPFPLTLRALCHFDHGRGSYTLWLVPEPMQALIQLQATWQPLSFMVEAIQLIWRQPPSDDVFRVDRAILLGKSTPPDLRL